MIEVNAQQARRIRELVAQGMTPDEAAAHVRKAEVAPANEKVFTDIVLRAFRSRGWIAYHTHDSRRSEPGFPDIVAAHPQHGLVFAELKMPSGRLSEAQRQWLHTLERAGCRAYVWRPSDWITIEMVAEGGLT